MKREINEKLGGAVTELHQKMAEVGLAQHELKELGKQITETMEKQQARTSQTSMA